MKIKATRQTLITRVETCLTKGGIHFRQFDHYYDKVLRSVYDEIYVNTGSSKMEERRAIWTTYWHINAWFDTLKEFLISHGFARLSTEEEMKEIGSELYFFEGKIDIIINLDESEISTDGTSKISGGRPATTYTSTDSIPPKGVEAMNKSGYSATFIGGYNVAGLPLPPHFQLKSTSREDSKNINTKFLKYLPKIVGTYDCGKVVENECKVNCNAKAGMEAIEYLKYFQTSDMPLYPDAQDTSVKRVLIIVDIGPGRLDLDMLATLRARGFYIMVGVY